MDFVIELTVFVGYLLIYDWIRVHKGKQLGKYVVGTFVLFGLLWGSTLDADYKCIELVNHITGYWMPVIVFLYFRNVPRDRAQFEIERYLMLEKDKFHNMEYCIRAEGLGKKNFLNIKKVIELVEGKLNTSSVMKEKMDMNLTAMKYNKRLNINIKFKLVEDDERLYTNIRNCMNEVIENMDGLVNENKNMIETIIKI